MKLSHIIHVVAALAWWAASTANTHAQPAGSYSLTWVHYGVGGGQSAGGACTLNATVGQTQVGATSSGNFTLAAGFWPAITQEETEPILHIAGSAGSVIVSWPDLAASFHLEHCSDLGRRNWISNASPVFVFGTNRVVVEPASGLRFYRLCHP